MAFIKNKKAINLIIEERERQIYTKKWSRKHDDRHFRGELAMAAACYAGIAGQIENLGVKNIPLSADPGQWPWHQIYWKPSEDPVRNLVKAGALIVAEIERIQRIKK